jgi:2,3-dihydroxyphenylpropionate 1,2-dioxygenase
MCGAVNLTSVYSPWNRWSRFTGAVQPMEIIYGDITARPFVPIFINCMAPPFTPMRRVRLLGETVGRHLGTLDKKVLLISSGGLSHDPPVPQLATATPEQRRMLIGEAGPLSPEARDARQQRVITAVPDGRDWGISG